MSLTDRQKETIKNSLSAKGMRAICPMCGKNNWDMGEDMVAAFATQPGAGIGLGGRHIPMIQLVCTNCGFISHHAAAVLGIQINP